MPCPHDMMITEFDCETRERHIVCGDCGKVMEPSDFGPGPCTFVIDTATPPPDEQRIELRADPKNYATVTIRKFGS